MERIVQSMNILFLMVFMYACIHLVGMGVSQYTTHCPTGADHRVCQVVYITQTISTQSVVIIGLVLLAVFYNEFFRLSNVLQSAYIYWRDYRAKILRILKPFQLLFSRGILNPKIP
jgi:hypothetical protein